MHDRGPGGRQGVRGERQGGALQEDRVHQDGHAEEQEAVQHEIQCPQRELSQSDVPGLRPASNRYYH